MYKVAADVDVHNKDVDVYDMQAPLLSARFVWPWLSRKDGVSFDVLYVDPPGLEDPFKEPIPGLGS